VDGRAVDLRGGAKPFTACQCTCRTDSQEVVQHTHPEQLLPDSHITVKRGPLILNSDW
ncbi:hypothetical protein KUCAC02_016230, partial [Chaenocephalus aceratus]